MVIGCLTCCHYFTTNVKGAYDDLATITMAASMAPMSVIGGPTGFYTTLETHPEENEEQEEDTTTNVQDGAVGADDQQQQSTNQELDQTTTTTAALTTQVDDDMEHQPLQEVNQYVLMNDHRRQENRPLLHPSFNGSVAGTFEEPQHVKKLYRFCSIIYYVSVLLVVALVGVTILYYPKRPVYNVCNDAVAWKKIMTNIAALKLDASFEILISLSNPNRLDAALDRGKGSFSYDGKQVGTFEIPPVTADAMAINDLMLITHVSPDRQQALALAEAYYMGKLILEAEFEGTIRIPAFFDYTLDVSVKHIEVDVNAMSDRSLCHCVSTKKYLFLVLFMATIG
jgi:hypothetical protein